jgi:hypothetical protein
MATETTPSRVNGSARPESDLSQVLSHGPALRRAYGRAGGGLLLLVAILKASRGPLGLAAIMTVAFTAAYKFWCG